MKKTLSILLVFLLVLQMAVPAYAAQGDNNLFTVTANTASAQVGDTVYVTVSADSAYENMSTVSMKVYYDAAAFELDADATTISTGNPFFEIGNPQQDADGNYVTLSFMDFDAKTNVAIGEYATLAFRAIAASDAARFWLSKIKLADDTLMQVTYEVKASDPAVVTVNEAPAYTGYAVSAPEDKTITAGETAEVQVTVSSEENPTYNAYDLTLTYDTDKLTYVSGAAADADASVTESNGTIRVKGYETVSGERLWPDGGGAYLLCEGYSYTYALTKYGYVGQSGTLGVTRDDSGRLVVTDGTECYAVSESENGGAVRINWSLAAAPANSAINTGLTAQWPDFRGSASNNGVTDAAIPTSAGEGTLYWANHIGSGFDADAVGSPILVDGGLITYAGSTLYRVDTVTGEVKATGTMDHKSSFAITPPTYADGMLFVALSNGTVQAFNAATLESLWVYADPLGGQPNSPLTVKNGYVYTGFWNSETGDANFVCLSVTDEDPDNTGEAKAASWHYTSPGGYYWAGAYVSDDFLLVGTDDGAAGYTSQTSRLLLLDPKTGALLDSWDGLNADVRSTVVYDSATNAYYFTSKGGTFYSVQVSSDRKLTNRWSTALQNGAGGVPMSTCSPVVYNGRAYVGVSGPGQFTPYSGHNITVIDLGSRSIAYCVQTQGYPQTSGLLTTAYEEESGYVYIYFFDNMTPGKLRVLRDKAGQTAADYVTAEGSYMTAYALFTPAGDQAQYAICSPIVDEYGTIYFKNDSAYLMAFGSAIETIEVTAMPDKIVYAEGETFDPAGMVVTATYANGMTRDITAYVSYGTEPLTAEDARFTISFDHVMYHNEETGTAMNAGVPTVTPTAVLELTIGTTALGDVNGDGSVDAADAQMILDHEARNTEGELPLETADVSGDGVIDSNDAVLILQYAKNLISAFPAAAEAASEP